MQRDFNLAELSAAEGQRGEAGCDRLIRLRSERYSLYIGGAGDQNVLDGDDSLPKACARCLVGRASGSLEGFSRLASGQCIFGTSVGPPHLGDRVLASKR